jgi:hypothetical protein
MQLFYHFGSKHLARKRILSFLLPLLKDADEYREPLVGAGAIALSVMSRYPHMPCWINDRDPAIAALWRSVKEFPDELIDRVREFDPNVPDFRAFSTALDEIDALPEPRLRLSNSGSTNSRSRQCAGRVTVAVHEAATGSDIRGSVSDGRGIGSSIS